MVFENVFSPIKIRGMEMRNRVIFPAMGTKMAGKGKEVTDQIINYHVARSNGGNGLNFTEVCSVYDKAAPKSFLSISDDKYIPGLKKLVDAIHLGGAKAGVQLWLGGSAVLFGDPTSMVVVPSEFKVTDNYIVPGASKEIIDEAVKAFGDAAKRSVEAGFDAIEFHAGHNYTPHSFLSKAFNKRTDEYGGSLENRARFLLECIRSIRANVPEDMPLFMRIDAHDDYVQDGLNIEDVIQFCKWAKEAGVDALDVSRGNFSSAAIKYEVPPVDLPRGFNVENAARIKKETGMLTVAVGRINDPRQADEIIKSGKADMVVIGRAQLADPEFCNKAMNGNVKDIVRCVGCNQGCYDGFSSPDVPFITCLRNPALGREAEFTLEKTNNPKKVLVVGGGVAGLQAAMELKDRGHNPILCEASNSLGGQFVLAGAAPRKEEMKEAAISMGEMAERKGVEIRLSTPVTIDVIKDINPDEVIIAAGAEPMKLRVPGADLPHVTNSHDILAGTSMITGQIVVIGGGLVGLEVAEYLSGKVNDITVVEMLNEVAKDLGQLRKICVMESLYRESVKTITEAKCVEIKEKSIVIDRKGNIEEIPCDSVVVAIGARSRDFSELTNYCEEKNIAYHVIGDAVRARRALNSIEEAVNVARQI
ncbi:FAD-dependent oxidoreductase [uncultured Clostridium sp.]|uniref:bile acid Fe-S flavoenzyme BaiCD n=1 Tax=uncultured Clostridium sp. TaxID=59620 RepID=UPI0025EED9A4|nr:FAD-dependent oxidoreductase [uncultured Clostridium sp.]